jgi:hypothetical protein
VGHVRPSQVSRCACAPAEGGHQGLHNRARHVVVAHVEPHRILTWWLRATEGLGGHAAVRGTGAMVMTMRC